MARCHTTCEMLQQVEDLSWFHNKTVHDGSQANMAIPDTKAT